MKVLEDLTRFQQKPIDFDVSNSEEFGLVGQQMNLDLRANCGNSNIHSNRPYGLE